MQRIERKVLSEVALFVSDNGPKKRRKETGCLLEKVHGDLRERQESSPDDREIEFPEEILLPFVPVSVSRRFVHLFISCEGCANTYAIEMKFLINK